MDGGELQQFLEITGCPDRARAQFFMGSAGGNLEAAIENYFASEGDADSAPVAPQHHLMSSSPPAARMPSAAAVEPPAAKPKAQNYHSGSQARIATFASLRNGGGDDDDDDDHDHDHDHDDHDDPDYDGGDMDGDDDDDGNEYYTGGKSSGMAVQAPGKRGKNLFGAMRRAGARAGDDEDGGAARPAAPKTFTGAGMTLGSSSQASVPVGTPQPQQQQQQPQQQSQPHVGMRKITITMWRNGFSVNDGEAPVELLNFETHKAMLSTIMTSLQQQRIPPMFLKYGQDIEFALEDERARDFVAPKIVAVPFSGAGHRLGAPVHTAPAPAAAAAAAAAAVAPAVGGTAAATAAPPSVPVDATQPTTKLQLRLADGSRLMGTFNHTHTVADVRAFIRAARPNEAAAFVLKTAFPNHVIADESQTLAAAGLLNAVIIQTFKA